MFIYSLTRYMKNYNDLYIQMQLLYFLHGASKLLQYFWVQIDMQCWFLLIQSFMTEGRFVVDMALK